MFAIGFIPSKCLFHVGSAAHILGYGGAGTEVVQSVAKLALKGPNKIMLEKPKIFSEFCVSAPTMVEFRDCETARYCSKHFLLGETKNAQNRNFL
jgi:hypothetical protein